MIDLDWSALALLLLSGLFVGFAKTGVSTVGMMAVILLTFVFPARETVGLVLPILIVGDIIAVVYYRRSVVWKHLFSLIPWVLTGIVAGYAVLSLVDSTRLSLLMGTLILALVIAQFARELRAARTERRLPQARWFNGAMGVLAGFATMIGNVAGVIMAVYLMSKQLPKQAFVGTGAWFFLFVNVIKVPFYVHLGLIDGESLGRNLWMLPAALAGAWIGVKVLPRIPQKQFQTIVLLLGAGGAIRLVVMGL